MKINIIYDSKHGNGEKIAEDLMDMIKESGNEGHIYNARRTDPEKIGEADLYIFGSPTHWRGPSRRIRRIIKKTPFAKEGAKYALFTTYTDGKGKATDKMEKMLEGRGLRKGASNLNMKLDGKEGPLEKGHREKVKRFWGEFAG